MINILNLLLTLASILNAVSALPLTSMVKTNATSKAATASTADGYAVKSLPGLEKMDPKFVPEMHAGYIEIDPSTKEDYFFWKFSKIHEDSKADNRLIFWFNGGPGCSSMDGALEETGPLTVNDQGEVEYRAGSWLENGNLVFIDQPVGTGFSTGDKDAAELINIASDMLTFIKKYLGLFPEDAKKEIYLSGESYAGQYVPYFGAKILMDAPEINLQGLVIVNGYIYPDVQDSALIDFAYENQLISSSGVQQAQDDVQQCLEDIDQNIKEYGEIYSQIEKYGEYQGSKNTMGSSQNKISSDSCANLLYDVLQLNYTANAPADEKCMNMYDFALRDSYPSCGGENFPVGESTLTSFLRSSEVDSALHIHGTHTINSIVISLKGISNTSIEDTSSASENAPAGEIHQLLRIPKTVFPDEALASQNSKSSYTFQQGEYIYNFDFIIPKDEYNIQCVTTKSSFHLKGFLKDDKSVLPPITLPPSLQHKRSGHDFVNIEYSVDVELYKSSNSKPSIAAHEVFLFVPKMTFITFSASSIKRKTSTIGKIQFTYKESLDQNSGDNESNKPEKSSGSGARNILSLVKKVIPNSSKKSKINCTFKLQARYNCILEPYNTQYNSTRFIKDGTLLSDFLRLSLFTKTRFDDLVKQIYPSSANTNSENLADEGEKLILDSLKIKLITNLQYKSHLLNTSKDFKKVIVDSENLNYVIPHEDFQPVSTAESQESDGSNDIRPASSISSTSTFCEQSEKKNALYKFDIPTSFYNCRLETIVPSFVICNVKVTHSLHINATFKSSLSPKQEGNFKLVSNIIVLKDFLANTPDSQYYEESVLLPMYSSTSIPAYGVVENLS